MFEIDLLEFPAPESNIRVKYVTFKADNKASILRFLMEKFNIVNISDQQIDTLLDIEILEPIIKKSKEKIIEDCWTDVSKFACSFDLRKSFNHEKSMEFVVENIKKDNHVLKNIMVIDEVKFLEDQDDMRKIIYKNKNELLEEAKKLNETLNNLYLFLGKIVQKIYEKHEIFNEYLNNYEYISKKIEDLLRNNLKGNFPELFKEISKKITQVTEQITKQIKPEIQHNIRQSLSNFCNFYSFSHEYKLINEDLFNEEMKANLGFIPSLILTRESLQKLREVIDFFLREKLTNLMKNHKLIETELKPVFDSHFYRYIFQKEPLFSDSKIRNSDKKVLFDTLCYSQFQIKEEIGHRNFTNYLEKIKNDWFTSDLEVKSHCESTFQRFSDFQFFQENTTAFKKRLMENNRYWNDKIDDTTNLYVIFSIVVASNEIRINQNNNEVFIGSYKANIRNTLKIILRNFRNGDFEYLNFQLMACIESLIEEALTHPGRPESPMDLYPLVKIHREKENKYLDLIRQNADKVSAKRELEACLQTLRRSIFDKSEGSLPIEFQFQKISPNKNRVITIVVSGFLSSNTPKDEEWKRYLDHDTETEVYALLWDSCSAEEQYSHIGENVGNMMSLRALTSNKYMQVASVAYFIYNMVSKNPFHKAHSEAKLCGKYLAHILAKGLIFGNCCINLVSFSLGTVLVSECILELEKLKQTDVINDVFLLGGCADLKLLNKRTWSPVSGKVVNCYIKNDAILEYLFRLAKFNEVPIGLYPIEAINEKIKNFDLSDIVDGHYGYRKKMTEIFRKIDFERDFSPIEANLN